VLFHQYKIWNYYSTLRYSPPAHWALIRDSKPVLDAECVENVVGGTSQDNHVLFWLKRLKAYRAGTIGLLDHLWGDGHGGRYHKFGLVLVAEADDKAADEKDERQQGQDDHKDEDHPNVDGFEQEIQ
jgi:hypothetical protein